MRPTAVRSTIRIDGEGVWGRSWREPVPWKPHSMQALVVLLGIPNEMLGRRALLRVTLTRTIPWGDGLPALQGTFTVPAFEDRDAAVEIPLTWHDAMIQQVELSEPSEHPWTLMTTGIFEGSDVRTSFGSDWLFWFNWDMS